MRPPTSLAALFAAIASCAAPPALPPAPSRATAAPPRAAAPRPAATRLIVLPPTLHGAALFAEERARVRAAVARFLAARTDVHIVPLEDVDAVLALAAGGHTRRGGPRCAAPPPAGPLLRLAFPRELRAVIDARCTADACPMEVLLKEAPGSLLSPAIAGWIGAAAPPAAIADWEAAVPRLFQPRCALQTLGRYSGAEPTRLDLGHRLQASVIPSGPWAAPPAASDFAPAAPALAACPSAPFAPDEIVLEISPRGDIARCEAERDGTLLPPRADACPCLALRGSPGDPAARFSSGPPGRRLAVELSRKPDPEPRPEPVQIFVDEARMAADPLVAASFWPAGSWPLARCFSALGVTGRRDVTLRLDLAPTGRVTRVTTSLPAGTLQICLENAALNLPLTCTASGEPATATITMRVQGFAR